MPERRPRAAVIGSGFGGLAVAIRLQAAGFETTIYERRGDKFILVEIAIQVVGHDTHRQGLLFKFR